MNEEHHFFIMALISKCWLLPFNISHILQQAYVDCTILLLEQILEENPDAKYNISEEVNEVLMAWDEMISKFEI